MREHLVQRAINIFPGKNSEAVAEIRERMQPRIVHAIEHADHEKRIFADRIVVFQVDGYILGSRVLCDRFKPPRDALHIGMLAFYGGDIEANAGRTDARRNVNPCPAKLDGALAFRRISRIDTAVSVGGDVHEGTASFAGNVANLIEMAGFKRKKVLAPRFDFADVKFRGYVSGEILKRHL